MSTRDGGSNGATAVDDASKRRNPRRSTSKTRHNNGDAVSDGAEEDSDNHDDDVATSEDEEDDEMEVEEESDEEPKRGRSKARGGKSKKTAPDDKARRSSSRANRYQASLKEPNGESSRDAIYGSPPTPPPHKKKSTKNLKSPAVRHKARRRQVKTEVAVSTEDSSSEEEDTEEEEDEEDELKVQRIIASKSDRRSAWKTVCEKINTSEIESGSRWYEEDDDEKMEGTTEETFEERFLVKWDDLSYLHCSWETQEDLVEQIENAKNYLTTFFRKSQNGFLFTADERCDGDWFDPAYTQIERILSVELQEESKGKGIIMDKSHADFDAGTGRQLLIKWGNTPYSDCTYEFERDLLLNEIEYEDYVAQFFKRSKKPTKSEAKHIFTEGDREDRRLYKFFGNNSKLEEDNREAEIAKYQKVLADKIYPNGGQLRDYQAEGVSWMMSNYVNQRSSLLADEMGLGKTLQTCSFINLLATKLNRKGPILVVAPLSTLEHWKREFSTWTGLNTIVYHGSAHNREQTRELEFAYEQDRPRGGVAFNSSFLKKCFTKKSTKNEKLWMAQVVVTTPEMLCTDDFSELTAVEWDALVVDEAHRLKNHSSKLATNLRDKRFTFNHKLLLTGTPIQNNMTELWTLLNIIDPESFDDLETFLESYGDIKSKEGVDELHENIRPYILRRLKEDVEKSVPPKEETFIEVELTTLQKQYYRALYEKNVQFLHRNKKKALDGPSISNLAMQLRKCCNHPFLLTGVEEDVRNQEKKDGSDMSEGDFLVKASGKLVLLDKLLPRLKTNGHRVLVFSQFKIMLDILEDYFHERQYKAERIDGSITGKKRQMAIDRFQSAPAEGKEAPFIMMLSTRAGGVGINLTAADTCIIFDSDWNPQNDLQAQARCHRIGQTKSVKVYRLLTRKTYEMQMFHMSSLKMGLDQAVLQGFESDNRQGDGALSKEEVEKLLRHGAYDIFNEEKAGTTDAESNAFISQDLDSILERRATTVVHENTGSKSSAAGGTFSKASFKAPPTPDGKKSGNGAMDVDIDDPDFWEKMVGEAQVDDVAVETGNKRKRKQANYSETAYKDHLHHQLKLSDSEDSESDDSDAIQEDDFDEDDASDTSGSGSQPKKKKRRKEYAKWGRKDSHGWKRADADKLVKCLHVYGYGNMPWEEFGEKCELIGYDAAEIQHMSWSVILTTLLEVAEENVAANKRKLERAELKKKATQEYNQEIKEDSNGTSGGVLGMKPQNIAADAEKAKKALEHQFRGLMNSQHSWLPLVLRDAKLFAMSNSGRPKEIIERYLVSSPSKNKQPPQGKNALFAQNLWPQLKSRGWNVEQVTNDGQMSTKYIFGNAVFKSPESVMLALASIHPELASTVDEVQHSLAMLKIRDSEEKSYHLTRIGLSALTADALKRHLHQFAPLQMVVDRATSKRLSLVKRLLTTCSTLFNAHDIVKKAKIDTSAGSAASKIAQSLMIDKRVYLPLPAWTANHDAILILAIAKHGWIEHDACCRAITDDKTIRWGRPFEGDETDKLHEVASQDDNVDTVVSVANRVAQFFTTERETLDLLKDFKEALLVKTYCLQFNPATEDSAAVWGVDETTLRGGCSDQSQVRSDRELVDLPTKKDLVKRAKNILGKRIVIINKPLVELQVEQKVDHGYQVLDLKDPANQFLAETLRVLLKVSFNNSGKRRQMGRRMMNAAINEAKNRTEDIQAKMSNDAAAIEVMKRVCDHCSFANRYVQTLPVQAKNVVRAMLGMPFVTPKISTNLFPPVRATLNIESVSPTQAAASKSKPKKQRQKKNREKGASGDIAISSAMSAVSNDENAKAKALEGACVQLSAPETLLLTVVCSQGLPIWTDNWHDLIDSTHIIPEKQGPGFQNAITWWGMGQVFEAAARVWHHTAYHKFESNNASFIQHFSNVADTDAVKQNARKKLEMLKQDESRKRVSLAVAGDYKNNPEKLAKKCVMLLENLRNHMGPVESLVGKSVSRIAKLNKTENGLGPFVLEWLTNEIRRWAESLKLVDAMGEPLSYTAADFTPDDPNDLELHAIAALMDRKACRTVFSQVAQQSRVREVFLNNTDTGVKFLLRNAIQDFADPDEWAYKPSWWGNTVGDSSDNYAVTHDFLVLDSLLEYGYSGIEETLAHFKEQQGLEVGAKEVLARSDIQLRANQLARALHILDRTQRAILEVREQAGITKPAAAAGLAQPGSIQSYFGSKTGATVIDIEVPIAGNHIVDLTN